MKKLFLIVLLCAVSQGCPAQSKSQKSPAAQQTEAADQTVREPNQSDKAAAPVVCIDPGHPSETSAGNEVQNGTTEVHIVWLVGLKLKTLLEAEGIRVVMTKAKEEELVTNKQRAMIANGAKADLMMRLHCDASTDNGYAVYAPDRQGKVQGVTGPSQEVIKRSRAAAEIVHQGMKPLLDGVLKDDGVRGDSQTAVGSRQGALTGSIFSEVPAVLIEMVVLSNKNDAEFIKAEEGQQKMAKAIAEGIKLYLKQKN
jgi:N-acetylmuramoyl-L-alanine amidase